MKAIGATYYTKPATLLAFTETMSKFKSSNGLWDHATSITTFKTPKNEKKIMKCAQNRRCTSSMPEQSFTKVNKKE